MKKLMASASSFLLCCCLLFSALSLNVSAAEVEGLYTSSMKVSAKGERLEGSSVVYDDLSGNVFVSSGSYLGRSCVSYSIPSNNKYIFRFVSAFYFENLNSSHEYNLKFALCNSVLDSTIFGVYLVFYDSAGEILREQELFTSSSVGQDWIDVDVDFKIDTSGLGGYKTKLEFRFVTTTTSSVLFRLSETFDLTDKEDNSSWFEKIIAAIKEIPDKLHNLGDRISTLFSDLKNSFSSDINNQTTTENGFFQNLGDRISTFFSALKSSFSSDIDNQTSNERGFFQNLGDRISTFFTNLSDTITSKLQSITDSIQSKFEEISNNFTEFFDRFKPRVYEELRWVNARIDSSGELSNKPDVVVKRRAATSDLFFVPSGAVYKLDVSVPSDSLYSITVYKYYSDGSYLTHFSAAEGVISLDEGYSYRFQIIFVDTVSDLSSSELSDLCNSFLLLYADEGWLTAFGHWLINSLSNLFIPSDYYFDDYSEAFQIWAVDHLGFLYTVSDLFLSLVNDLGDLLSDDYSFVMPAAEFYLNGEHFVLWEEYELPIAEYIESVPALKLAYNTYCVMLVGVLCFGLLNYARKTYDKITAN